MNYLRNGRMTNHNFVARFKMHGFFEIHKSPEFNTDGRYYTFLFEGKPITIDIGFNFYDVNAKNWIWKKANEYD